MSQDTNLRSCLLVIDMQKGSFTEKTPRLDAEGVVERINKLAGALREMGRPVIFIQHDGSAEGAFIPGSPAWELLPELKVEDSDILVSKTANDSFYQSELKSVLDRHKVGEVVITGCATDFCVESTVQSALARDYEVTVVTDGHTTADRPHLTASQVIEHYHWVWQQLTPTNGKIKLLSAQDLLGK